MPFYELPPPPPAAAGRVPLSPSRSPNSLPQHDPPAHPSAQAKRAAERGSIGSQIAQLQLQPRAGAADDGQQQQEVEGQGEEEDVSMDLAITQSQPVPQPGPAGALGEVDGRKAQDEEVDELDDEADEADAALESLNGSRSGSRRNSRSGEGEEDAPALHVEIRLKPTSTVRYDLIRRLMHQHLDGEYETLLTHSEVHDWRDVGVLAQEVDRVWIGECALPTSAVPLDAVCLHLHVYQPPSTSRIREFSTSEHADEDGDTDVPAASVLELPSLSLDGVWDTLIYDGDVKGKLLSYIHSTMLFSDAMVDFNVVTWNRYQTGKLIEINSHSLFSKWFSESGKLVQRLFAQVTEMVDDESCFVVVLIDEVESLTAARAGAMSGKEPSDALRVVNALLTQLDKLKTRKNVLIMTTSNLSGAIDNAFIDRADIKQYIGLPPAAAVYWILQSCLDELMRAGLIPPVDLKPYKEVDTYLESSSATRAEVGEPQSWACSERLYELANACQGLSGRTLRRLPVLAHARHLSLSSFSSGRRAPLEKWLDAMCKCVEEEGREMERVEGAI
ncbi:hypothetical protein JCM10213v2_006741 [Rhodosporidiobolus nylandii]